jgi:oligopeptide transport system substrate-binding protein
MSRRRFIHGSILSALFGKLAAGTTAALANASASATLRRSRGGSLTTLDPHRALSAVDLEVAAECFLGLTTLDVRGEVIPGCARSWQVSADGKRYEFRLRPNLRWSDDSPLTAADFARSIRRLLQPATGALLGYRYDAIRGARALRESRPVVAWGVTAPSNDVLIIDLERPETDLLKLLVLAYPVPLRQIEQRGSDWAKPPHIIVNGAYRPVSWAQNGSLVLERNPRALRIDGETQPPQRVEWVMGVDDTTRWRLFRSGELQLAQIGDAAVLDTARREMPRAVHTAAYYGGGWLGVNLQRPRLGDVRLRRLLSLATDRSTLVDKVRRLGERASESLVPEAVSDYAERARPAYGSLSQPQRLQQARELARSLGLERSKPLTLRAIYSTNPLTQRTFLALDAMWAPLGVRLESRGLESRAYSLALNQGDFDLMDYSPFSAVQSATSFIGRFQSGSFLNYSRYSNPEVDRLIEVAERQMEPTRRAGYYLEVEKILLQDLPVIPLFSGVTHRLIANRVGHAGMSSALAMPSQYLSLQGVNR